MKRYNAEAAKLSSFKGMMGPRGQVNEETRHIAAAAGWGLFPDQDATYLNYNGKHDYRRCFNATYPVPENKGFWSITVYGEDCYMKHDNSILNSNNVKFNPDGTVTAYFGSPKACGDIPNRLDVDKGWNFLMRIYLPGPSVIDGTYKLPPAVEIKQAGSNKSKALRRK